MADAHKPTLADFDYTLPLPLIAQHPTAERDQSRLMVVHEAGVEHHLFHAFPELLQQHIGPHALLVFNNTRVIPARLYAHKIHPGGAKGGQVELLLCEPVHEEQTTTGWRATWRCLAKGSKGLRRGMLLHLENDTHARAHIVHNEGGGYVQVQCTGREPEGWMGVLEHLGHVPLPPYIRHGVADVATDTERYQTVYAQHPGAVAAPTAGLHFTPAMLQQLDQLGFERAEVTLHVGPGTFAPVQADDFTTHVMHAERYHIPQGTATTIARAKSEGRPVVAIGTTVVRALESATAPGASLPQSGWGESRLFIYPPYSFRVVDALLTNFHLPQSTLLMLVAALCGQNRVLSAYGTAVEQSYRFFSYGDAMLIPRRMNDVDATTL